MYIISINSFQFSTPALFPNFITLFHVFFNMPSALDTPWKQLSQRLPMTFTWLYSVDTFPSPVMTTSLLH